jgi:hypothetical protein
MLTYFHWEIQNGRLKTTEILNSPNPQYCFVKILCVGLLEKIDAKGINVAQPIWLSDCPT